MERGDWSSYVDTIRPVYEPEELIAMFRVSTDDEAPSFTPPGRHNFAADSDPLAEEPESNRDAVGMAGL